MFNHKSIEKVNRSIYAQCFRKPLYSSYCFSKITGSIENLFTGNCPRKSLPLDCVNFSDSTYDVVILFLLDGFGWRFFEKYYEEYPFLKRFVQEGVVSKITSQFPSTTAAHVTTINTGQEVGRTGIYEWFYYEPKVDRIIAPLLFSIAGEKTLGSLEKLGVTPEQIFPKKTFYQHLKQQKIDSFIIQPENIINSHYSKTVTKGAHPLAYMHFDQGLKTLCEGVNQQVNTPTYFHVYFSDIDSSGHRNGIESKEFDETVAKCMRSLEESFYQLVERGKKKIACLVTADHGMCAVKPSSTFYLNKEVPEILEMISTNAQGKLLAPCGSCRDLFLHIKKSKLDHAQSLLQKKLQDKALVVRSEELIDQNFFGSRAVSQTFLEKVGNLVILPFEQQSVWWYEKGVFEQHFYGSHGGLTPSEMDSIFLFLSL